MKKKIFRNLKKKQSLRAAAVCTAAEEGHPTLTGTCYFNLN
jgi:hypothetical protein